MSDALINKMSNIGYDYTSSLNCLNLVHTARTAGADFFNCKYPRNPPSFVMCGVIIYQRVRVS